MNPDSHILALLSDGAKSFTEIADKIVPDVCARGTLVTHLKGLVQEKKIKRDVNTRDRTTRYSLTPDSIPLAQSASDSITLDSLMNELENKTRKDLILEKAEAKEASRWKDLLERISLPNKPRAGFLLRLDKDTMRMTNLVQPTSDIANELEELITDKLNTLKSKIPGTILSELDFLSESPRNWSEILGVSDKIAKKHGFRFLVASWYDGRNYGQRILSAIKSLEKLGRNRNEDIAFLDEVNKRCFYSDFEYYWEDPVMIYPYETMPTIPDSTLLQDAFSTCFYKQQELMRLEVALISANPTNRLCKDLFKENWDVGPKRIHSPYKVLSADAYVKMKLPFLSERERNQLVEELLRYMRSDEAELYSIDYQLHREDYRLAIDLLAKKLNLDLDTDFQENVNSPIMNFKFYDDSTLVDFSDEPLVTNFLEFRDNSEKRKWLQKCLSQGLPIFTYVPFDKLGFELKDIF